MSIISRAVLVGLATGGRSTSGLAALALTNKSSGGPLSNPWVGRLAATAAAGELVGDKLPQTPGRLQPQGLAPRLLFGGAAAAILAHREGGSARVTALAAALGVLGGAAGAQLGASWRQLAQRKLGSDLPGALIEDASWIAAAHYATRPPRSS
jgi:uncharacterized membrane protein